MTRYTLAMLCGMLLVPGCKSERPVPSGQKNTPNGTTPALRSKAATPPIVVVTATRTVDTTKLADTAVSIRVRNALITDTIRVVKTSLPAMIEGIAYGPSEAPLKSLCDTAYQYTGTILGIGKAKWITAIENGIPVQRQDTAYNRVRNELTQAELDSAAYCRAKVTLRIARKSLSDSTGRLSVTEALKEVRTWPKTWAQHPAFLAFHLGDDPADPAWGYSMPVRMVMWDSIACGAAKRFDVPSKKTPLWLRARPVQMEEIGKVRDTVPVDKRWECMTTAMAQWAHRLGDPNVYFQKEIASAKRQKLGFVAALNLLNGGCGNKPASVRPLNPACFAPGTDRPGANTGMYQMSANEIGLVGMASLEDPYVCAHLSWSWWGNFKSPLPDSLQVQNIPENQAVLLGLANSSRLHPVISCIQR